MKKAIILLLLLLLPVVSAQKVKVVVYDDGYCLVKIVMNVTPGSICHSSSPNGSSKHEN